MIETDRLVLKNWQVDDAPALYRLASDPLVGPACGWQPHRNIEESRDLIANGPLSGAESYAIRLKPAGELVGSISLKPATEHFDIAGEKDLEVGYWLGSAYWGRGYASEALRALVARAFCDLGCPALWCGFFEGNGRSKHCMEKCGFTFVKTFSAFDRPTLGDTATAYYYRLDAADYRLGEDFPEGAK